MNKYRYNIRLKFFLTFFSIFLACNFVNGQTLGSLHTSSYQDQQLVIDEGTDLSKALKNVEDKFQIVFLYRTGILEGKKVKKQMTLSSDIESSLNMLLANQELRYKHINPKTYGIYAKESPKKDPIPAAEVSGTVTDAQSGETLPGVNIIVKNTPNRGTSTGADGQYNLTVPSLQDTLIFSYIGYQTREIAINGRANLDVSMTPTAVMGEEIVVVGYGTQQKKNVSGSIASVGSEDLEKAPVQRLDEALQGRLSGVRVTSSSGAPGASSTVRIRGTTSINNSNPLYVVDGVPVDVGGIGYLNPSDIESINVLKDAASAAIYGTRASSGVILVTTKDGSRSDFEISYSSYYGVQEPEKKLDLLNAEQYATLRNEASVAAGNGLVFQNPDRYGEGTDWQETIFNNSAAVLNQNLSISGGNETSNYFASLGYYDQEGIVASPISHNRKFSFRINSTIEITDRITFSENFSYTYERNRGSLNTNSEFGGPLSSAINLDPITPVLITDKSTMNSPPYSNNPVVRNSQGQPYAISPYVQAEMTNPLAYIETQRGNFGFSHNIVGNASLEVDVMENLTVKSDIGVKPAFYGSESFTPIYYLNAATNNLGNNSFFRANNRNLIWNWENTINYIANFKSHSFDVLVGTSIRETSSTGVNGTYQAIPARNFDDASMNFSVPTDQRVAAGFEGQPYALNSYFGRLNYDYDNRYMATAVLRYDGSSRFGKDNRFGAFPAFSVGWVPTSESFWPEKSFLGYLKVRGSYGVNGNDRSLGDFQYQSTVSGGRNYVFGPGRTIYTGSSPNAPANPSLQWEETTQLNVGFDATVLTDFSVTFDYYWKETSGMLLQENIPSYVGASGDPFGNIASLENKGVELELGYTKQVGDLSFNISANGSYNQNVITDIGTNDFLTGATFQASAFEITRTTVGHPIGAFYGFKTQGIFQNQEEVNNYVNSDGNLIQPNAQPGDFRWKDMDGDGEITSEDRTFLGNPTPPWTFGFNLSANWKQFDFSMFGQGVYGNEIFQGLRRLDITSANYTKEALNRWTGPGTSSSYPRLSDADPNNNFSYPSDFYLSDGSYFRIKSLQVGYTLPVDISTKMGIKNARIYVRGKNLATFTQYSGFDPEIGGDSFGIDRGIYPQARSYQIGIDLTF